MKEVSVAVINQLLQLALASDVGKAILGAYLEGIHEDDKRPFKSTLKDGKIIIEYQ